ncbi:CYTH and CHAD domain-containing protein [Kineococcus rhizosphaerae]|uniref:CHAD domain-containing protein n=1 Tax=Kineococcus rhizosphaerae TaxID=559628 RepID=A0A2T0R2X9_9ACTN|nr:CYTH and CHAD domain-containing protein [Kineococcus rhizosphaerae]PRY14135.1 CHAD domain-containing protein [Kineococcus rhizosphaerae]
MPTPRLALTRTYLAPTTGSAPGGGELPGVADVGPVVEVTSEETHYDTSDLALAAAGVSVRRQTAERTSPAPRGWVLELPGRGPRTHEVRHALGRAVRTAPAALQRLTWAAARGRSLGPVLALSTNAQQRDLLDEEGSVVARLTTRQVQATALSPEDSSPQTWGEWQVEVVDGRRDLLDAVTDAWEALGAEESDRTAQLRTVLDGPDDDEGLDAVSVDDSAGALVLGRLAQDVGWLLSQDPLARIDAPDAVRSLRVASRRLHNVLQTFAPLFAEGATEQLRAELTWITSVTGPSRDLDVLAEKLLEDLDEEAAGHTAGTGTGDPAVVAEKVRATLVDRSTAAHAQVLEALDSQRYRDLVAALEAFVADPPTVKPARREARKVLLPLVAEAHRAARDAYRDVDLDVEADLHQVVEHYADGADAASADEAAALVRLRTAVAVARDAAAVVAPKVGEDAEEYVDVLKELLDLLDEHADTVVTRAFLAGLVEEFGSGAFVLGRLHALEEVRSAVAFHDVETAWDAANHKKLRRFLK